MTWSELPAPPPPAPLATKLRTRAWWWLNKTVGFERLRQLNDSGKLRWSDPVLRRGELQVLGGLAPHLRISAQYFDPGGAQAFGVLTGGHEPMVQEALRRHLAPDGVFWDVGANIGSTTLVAAWLVGRGGHVLAFDAQAECVDAVRVNARLNGFDQVEVVHAAVGAVDGETEVEVVADTLWTHVTSVGAAHPLAIRRDRVRAVTLDAVVEQPEQRPPDVIKIDVEGAEIDVIAGAGRLLNEHQPIVICEMHGRNAEFAAAMAETGYAVQNLDGARPLAQAGDNVHAIAVPLSRLPAAVAAVPAREPRPATPA